MKTQDCGASTDGNAERKVKAPVRRARKRINGSEELAQVWYEFLKKKFSATERERLRVEFEALSESDDEEAELTRKEFDDAVDCMKNGKAVGADNIPAEVWKKSVVAKDALFEFLKKI